MLEIEERIIALTRDLMLIPSTHSRPEECGKCFRFIRNHLEQVPGAVFHEYESEGFGSLVVTVEGEGEGAPDVLLCGHIDVVDHADVGDFRSEVRGGRIWGPGAGDMKGAVAIMMELFRTLVKRNPGILLGLAITSDEERGGENGVRYLFEDVGLRCGVAIIPDGGSLADITVEEKGILHGRVRCRGVGAHAARPWLGKNALESAAAIVEDLGMGFREMRGGGEATRESHWVPTCSVTRWGTDNGAINGIPDDAWLEFDSRFTAPVTVAEIAEKVEGMVAGRGEVEVIVGAEPTVLNPDELFVKVTEEVTGRVVKRVRASGGSDARFICAHGIPVMLSRPLVGELHAVDEWVDIESMMAYYRICERYIEERLGLVVGGLRNGLEPRVGGGG